MGRVAPVIERMIELLNQHADTPFDVTYAFMCEAVEGFGLFDLFLPSLAFGAFLPAKAANRLR